MPQSPVFVWQLLFIPDNRTKTDGGANKTRNPQTTRLRVSFILPTELRRGFDEAYRESREMFFNYDFAADSPATNPWVAARPFDPPWSSVS